MPFSLGLDFGTESARAILVDTRTGEEVATAVSGYPHGVIDETLPTPDAPRLKPDSALQDPDDYLDCLKETVFGVMQMSGAKPADVIGIGVDFTACTVVPCKADATPLCAFEEFVNNPHAWVKLWKHHGAAAEADEIQAKAEALDAERLAYYGGALSSEWMMPKALEMLREAPDLYQAADLLVEAGDWLVWKLTGDLVRNATAAGYKGMWVGELGFPSPEFLRAVDPGLADLYTKKVAGPIKAAGERAGTLTAAMAEALGLKKGTPVSAATIDAHAGVPGCGAAREGVMTIITGTSQCQLMLSREPVLFKGFAGLVKDGIVKGFYGYESGQTAVGDIYAWFVDHCADGGIAHAAEHNGRSVYEELEARAAALKPGQAGVLSLDWWKGNRSILMDAKLSGLLVGLTLDTRSEHMYRAIVEGTLFGTRRIVDSYAEAGVAVDSVVLCGGLIERSPMFGRICVDVLNRPIRVAASSETVALGAAMFGALAAGKKAGGFDTVEDAMVAMVRPPKAELTPDPAAAAVYERLYALYRRAHDHFGTQDTLMAELRALSIDVC